MWYIINFNILKKILVIFIASIFTFLLCTPLRLLLSGEHFNALYVSAPIGLILYYILTFWLCKKYGDSIRPCIVLTIIICAIIIIQLPSRLFDFKGSAFTLPEQFIHLLGIIFGYLSFQKQIRKRIAMVIGGVCCILLILFFPSFCNYLHYGSITGKMENISIPNFKIINEEKDTLSLQELKGDYIIFDLWHRSCVSCIKAFPKVQKLYDKIQSKDNLSIYSLNYPIDDTDPFLFMRERGYNIPVLQILNIEKDMIMKQMGINAFPTIIILNRTRQIVFRGSIEMVEKLCI